MKLKRGRKIKIYGAVMNYDLDDDEVIAMQYGKEIWTVISSTKYLVKVQLIDDDLIINGLVHKKQIDLVHK